MKKIVPEIQTLTIPTEVKSERVLKGIPSSPGIAIGIAVVINPELFILSQDKISAFDIPKEIERFDYAINELNNDFNYLLNQVRFESKNVYAVIEANILLLNDTILLDSIKKRIKKGIIAESAIIQEFDVQKQFFLHSRDSLFKERAIEIDQIKERLLHVLRNKNISYIIGKNSIVIAQSLMPNDVLHFREAGIVGMITEVGGIAAHSSILARSFEIPEVIGIKNVTSSIEDGEDVIVDGYTGIVTINPSKSTLSDFKKRQTQDLEHRKKLGKLIKLPSETSDGHKLHLMTNINTSEDVESSLMVGADGVGLVRTENLILQYGHFPNEEEQFKWYNQISQQLYPNVVTFRAFDLGSDKYAEGMPKHESNPALGFRGIRFLLHRKDIFRTQIIAILRASKNKNVRFMLPMVSTVNEVTESLELMEGCKSFLNDENIPFDDNLPLGMMIETPASALLSNIFARLCKFFSIGSNDLTQYTLAADRTNELVSEFFDSFHPAVLQLIKFTIDAAQKNNIPVGICGELAGHAAATTLLIGLGIDELSVSPSTLLELKSRVRSIDYNSAKDLANVVLNLNSYTEVRQLLGIAG